MKSRHGLALGLFALGLGSPTFAAPLTLPSLAEILARGGDPMIPAEWAGVWEIADSSHDCGSDVITDASVEVDTLCTGEPIETGAGLECTTILLDEDDVHIECTHTEEISPGCELHIEGSIIGTRTGDDFYIELIFGETLVPPICAPFPVECTVNELTGRRIAAEPSPCTSPVVSESWGRTKARYR